MKKNWIHTRRDFLSVIKDEILWIEGEPSESLKSYQKEYSKMFQGLWSAATPEELKNKLNEVDLVLGGDFHAFGQSQRSHLRLLRELKRPFVLALEVVNSEDQLLLDKYLSQEISEELFLQSMDWDSRWGFPWEPYKKLIDYALSVGAQVIGVNLKSETDLKLRDQHAAHILNPVLKSKTPQTLVYCIYGDLHLADEHLIYYIDKEGIESLRLCLNPGKLYFDLAERGLENEIDVLKKGESLYALLDSPPWVKWQSYLINLEENEDQFMDETEGYDESLDFSDLVSQYIRIIETDLGLFIPRDRLSVYLASEVRTGELYESEENKALSQKIESLIITENSFYLPTHEMLYLSRPSVNQGSLLAGWYVHGILSERKEDFLADANNRFQSIWVEAIGFFLSKFINPERKAPREEGLQQRLRKAHPQDEGYKALTFVLDYRLKEIIYAHSGGDFNPDLENLSWIESFEAFRVIGEMLGERLFQSYSRGQTTPATLMNYLSIPLESKRFNEIYKFIIKTLEVQ